MKRVDTRKSYTEYAGCIAAYVTGGLGAMEAKTINVDMPFCHYVGGMVGGASNLTTANQHLVITGTFEDITVLGALDTGGVFGYSGRQNVDGITVRNATVTTSTRHAGAFAGSTGAWSYQRDILVTGCRVYGERDKYSRISTYSGWHNSSLNYDYDLGVGGYAGYLHTNVAVSRLRVEHTEVTSADMAGGVASYLEAPLRDVEVYDCDVKSVYNPNYYASYPYAMAAGGICATQYGWDGSRSIQGAVVRNSRITGRSCVGGMVGKSRQQSASHPHAWILDSYVAEDVEVKATGYTVTTDVDKNGKTIYVYTEATYVGGLVGYTQMLRIANCVCAASVSGPGNYVGGLVGMVNYDNYLDRDRYIRNSIYAGEEVRGGRGYVGGIIGCFNSAEDSLKEGAIKNVIVYTNVRSGDGKNSLWINDKADVVETNQDSDSIYIWEYSTLNGQTAKDIVATAGTAEGSSLAAKPASSKLIAGEELYKKSFYTDRGFAAASWWMNNFDEKNDAGESTNQYFPYSAYSSALLELARWSDASLRNPADWKGSDDKIVGVKLPPKNVDTTPEATVVYAAGIDILNVETAPKSAVTLCGVDCTTDDDGVASITCNFTTPTGIDNFNIEDLRRDTLVNGSWWYFIDKWGGENNGNLRTGSVTIPPNTVANTTDFVVKEDGSPLTKVIHLWGTQALTADGEIYELEGQKAVYVRNVGTLGQKDKRQPFLSYQHGNKKTPVEVYHNFTVYGTEKVENQRLYQLENKLYTLSAYKNYVYDGILLTTAGTGIAKQNYFAVLDKDGNLTSYLAAISREKWTSSGIKQMSNSFNPDDINPMDSNVPIVVLRYTNGRVCVVHYVSDKLVYDSGQPTGIVSYVGRYLTSLFRPSSDENLVPQDPTYRAALEEAEQYRAPETDPAFGLEVDNSASFDAAGDAEPTGDGTGGGEGADGQAPGEENNPSGEIAGSGQGNLSGGTNEAGGTGDGQGDVSGEPGQGSVPGEPNESDVSGEPGETGETDEDGRTGAYGTNQISGDGGPAGPGGDESGSAAGPEGGEPDAEGGEPAQSGSGGAGAANPGAGGAGAEELPETLFIQPEEGTVYKATSAGGLEAVPCGSVSYDEKGGTYSVDGKTYYPDQAAQAPRDLPEAVTLVSEELHTRQLMDELGPAMVAYDPVTGQYSPYVTESLLGDAPRKTTDPVPGKTLSGQDEETAVQGEAGSSSFEVGHGLGRDLTPQEQRGFTLLALAAVAAFGILGVIFVREKRRKR